MRDIELLETPIEFKTLIVKVHTGLLSTFFSLLNCGHSLVIFPKGSAINIIGKLSIFSSNSVLEKFLIRVFCCHTPHWLYFYYIQLY